ncbi:MAG: TlpA family protein disulfide reductase [Flavobacteriaceae bacterium]|jgi:thiol-disulfide isomerase/thioredoxin
MTSSSQLWLSLTLLWTLCLTGPCLTAQEEYDKTYFSQVIGKNIRSYRLASREARYAKDDDRLQFLFDSLVDHVVVGSYLDNFKVRKFGGRRIDLNYFKKPMYLITYADWCTPGVGEIPALNDIVEKNHQSLDFVVLFWGPRKSTRKIKQKLHPKITILFVNEKENDHSFIIRRMKHTLGLPTTFLLNDQKRILNVDRLLTHHYGLVYEDSYNKHFQYFTQKASLLKAQGVQGPGLQTATQ